MRGWSVQSPAFQGGAWRKDESCHMLLPPFLNAAGRSGGDVSMSSLRLAEIAGTFHGERSVCLFFMGWIHPHAFGLLEGSGQSADALANLRLPQFPPQYCCDATSLYLSLLVIRFLCLPLTSDIVPTCPFTVIMASNITFIADLLTTPVAEPGTQIHQWQMEAAVSGQKVPNIVVEKWCASPLAVPALGDTLFVTAEETAISATFKVLYSVRVPEELSVLVPGTMFAFGCVISRADDHATVEYYMYSRASNGNVPRYKKLLCHQNGLERRWVMVQCGALIMVTRTAVDIEKIDVHPFDVHDNGRRPAGGSSLDSAREKSPKKRVLTYSGGVAQAASSTASTPERSRPAQPQTMPIIYLGTKPISDDEGKGKEPTDDGKGKGAADAPALVVQPELPSSETTAPAPKRKKVATTTE
ncbi:hypothetical protein BDK51DRAFT_48947 [Blyttiomyces helicus]|uniref:Uncharacterized protein n=1 Tax=Blyttiomyces helicus TaxID=388810 RepID=A0A4P9W1B8_9FUNG|nr:hypothetical protein BDK51DRAFT_48947 [Blyttiomyces helicus]|eukprot:RKO84508.1 hypothetical protein BDK51DRAFT_48947 [Blyttiomyces helicus]